LPVSPALSNGFWNFAQKISDYQMVQPPSIKMLWPVIKSEAGLAREN
jgi:hypothetical protein